MINGDIYYASSLDIYLQFDSDRSVLRTSIMSSIATCFFRAIMPFLILQNSFPVSESCHCRRVSGSSGSLQDCSSFASCWEAWELAWRSSPGGWNCLYQTYEVLIFPHPTFLERLSNPWQSWPRLPQRLHVLFTCIQLHPQNVWFRRFRSETSPNSLEKKGPARIYETPAAWI